MKHTAATKKIEILILLYACALAFFYATESILLKDLIGENAFFYLRFATAMVSALFNVYIVLRHKLFKKWDVWVLFSFFVYVFLVTCFYYGFSTRLFVTTYYFMWMNLIFLFLAFRTVKEPNVMLRPVSFAFVFPVSLVECFIIVHATLSLTTTIPGDNRTLGCFRVGRLCGLGNANSLSFYVITAAMLAFLQFLNAKKKTKVFYGLALFLQWFIMGLANCRTTIVGFSFTCAIFALARLRKRSIEKRGSAGLQSWLVALPVSGVIGLLVMGSFLLPTYLYKGGVYGVAKLMQDKQTMENISLVYERNVTDVETLTDRELIWARSVELIFKNPRRTLFGTSIKSTEPVYGAYEGRHDIPMIFAHNTFLELFRKVGFIGLSFWIVLLLAWGMNAIRICFDVKTEAGICFLMAMGAGVLLTGMTEYGPFSYGVAMAVPIVFFICCGYCMRGDVE